VDRAKDFPCLEGSKSSITLCSVLQQSNLFVFIGFQKGKAVLLSGGLAK
jgi:hypothetical protein